MIKFRPYYDKDEGARWINKMADEGYAVTGFFAGFFNLEPCEPGKYTYQVDFSEKFFAVSNNYREFMQEAGVEIVQIWGPWVYLRKLKAEGPFELYTDVDSSIEHYRKIRKMFKVVAALEIACFFLVLLSAIGGGMISYMLPSIFLACAFSLIFVNMVIKTNHKLKELYEQKGEVMDSGCDRKISFFLPAGLFLNSIALILKETVHHNITITIQIAAICLMLIGIYRTSRIRRME